MSVFMKDPIFWIGVLIRIALIPLYGSYFLGDLFIPFLDEAVHHITSNPYSLGSPEQFPYGSALYFLLIIPRYLAFSLLGPSVLGAGFMGCFLVKAPLFCVDLCLLWALSRCLNNTKRTLLLSYWLNPIVIYITYAEGQLDLVPMALCAAGIIAITRKRLKQSALFLGLATASKFHVILCVPFVIVYIWRADFAKKALRNLGVWLPLYGVISFLGLLPLLLANRLAYATMASPQAMRIFGFQLNVGEGRVLFAGFALVLLLLGRLCLASRISVQGLIYGCGILFGVLLLVTDASAGWYFWLMPFLALFYAEFDLSQRLLPLCFSISYIITFAVFKHHLSADPSFLSFLFFSMTQAFLIGILLEQWVVCVSKEVPIRHRLRPLIIGIAGDSASGKDILSGLLADLFNAHHSAFVLGDDYHRWQRGDQNWQEYTHLDPKANELETLTSNIDDLERGRSVSQHHYNHETGLFTTPQQIRPNRTLIVQGLHTLYVRKMREKMDLRIFLSPQPELRKEWKILRDVGERNKDLEKVEASLKERADDSKKHIEPQRDFADWVIEYRKNDTPAAEASASEIHVKYYIWNDVPINNFVALLREQSGCEVSVSHDEKKVDRVHLLIKGKISADTIRSIANTLFPEIRFLTRSRKEPAWHEGINGVTQLLCLQLLKSRFEQ